MQAILPSHDIEAVQSRGMNAGVGVAHILDEDNCVPDVVHLSLTTVGSSVGRRIVPLTWSFDPSSAGEPADAPFATLSLDARGPALRGRCRVALRQCHPIECDVEIVETGGRAFTRNAAVLETDALSGMSVLCIGLGSGGSAVVDQLARAGIGRFVLWDMDRLTAHNVGRHVCTLADVGRKKTLAVRDHVQHINPRATVECVDGDVMRSLEPRGASPSLLDDAIASADCVIVGTDNNASRFAINDVAWRHRKPALYGRAFTRAAGGDVIQVLPPSTPCYACHIAKRVVDEEVSSMRDAQRIAYADRPVQAEPGLSIDIQPIANMIARLCVLRLCERVGSSLQNAAAELTAPLYLWANRREYQFEQWHPMGRTYDRLSVLRWYGIGVRGDDDCLTCGPTA